MSGGIPVAIAARLFSVVFVHNCRSRGRPPKFRTSVAMSMDDRPIKLAVEARRARIQV